MHDRRIDGKINVFGNAGALFMNAMTWFDHESESIWSQPWGRAIQGDLKGTELFVLPSRVITWGDWKAEHPETLVMINDVGRLSFRQGFDPGFVIGLLLDGRARAYYYTNVAEKTIINDMFDEFPVLLWAADNNYQAYLRQADGRTLTFRWEDGQLIDEETGSTWDIRSGLALAGPLRGQSLQPIPGSTAYDWAWEDFYPDTTFYEK